MYSRLFSVLFFLIVCSNIYGQQQLRRFFQPANLVNKISFGANEKAGRYVHAKDAKIYYEVYGKG